jgi:hypothetical protein
VSVPSVAMSSPSNPLASEASKNPRLRLAGTLGHGSVDGAWWPASRAPEAELRTLLDDLPDRGTAVLRIAMSRTHWDDGPRRIQLRGRSPLRVGWFTVVDPDAVLLTCRDGSRIRLLVIPPETPAAPAEKAMDAATGDDPSSTPSQILTATAAKKTAAGTAEVPPPRGQDAPAAAHGMSRVGQALRLVTRPRR